MTVFLADSDFTLYQGDVRVVLPELPDESVHCVVTSPPYYGLRDYGTGTWVVDCPTGVACTGCRYCENARELADYCEHETVIARGGRGGSGSPGKQTEGAYPSEFAAAVCGKCGARRVDRQLGLERTPAEYVEALVEVFREVRRVLRRDGVCWLVIGDSYISPAAGMPPAPGRTARVGSTQHGVQGRSPRIPSLKTKDLIGIPWRVAFALQDDGWYLRSEVIWDKPNAMPESVTDRPSKSHEQVFMLTKSASYFYDQDAVREPWSTTYAPGRKINETQRYGGNGGNLRAETLDGSAGEAPRGPDGRRKTHVVKGEASLQHRDGDRWPGTGRNLRSVWKILTQPYPGAHFAVFPEELAERCIKAGTSERGCCPDCEAPWERVIRRGEPRPVSGEYLGALEGDYKRSGSSEVLYLASRTMVRTTDGWKFLKRDRYTEGWRPTCSCYDAEYERSFPKPSGRWQRITWWERVRQQPIPVEFDWSVKPCVVFDPFLGAGTSALVARNLGRNTIGIELSEKSCQLAADRTRQLSLFA